MEIFHARHVHISYELAFNHPFTFCLLILSCPQCNCLFADMTDIKMLHGQKCNFQSCPLQDGTEQFANKAEN